MNIHHLELFYYVARNRGISDAVRNMPYGIQQPAVSSQIIQLEGRLGVKLFQRRPFALTPQGEELYHFIKPFFGSIDTVTRKLQGGDSHHIRISASEIILAEHLPSLIRDVRRRFPNLTLTLREGHQADHETLLTQQEIDIALSPLSERPPAGCQALPLLRLPLALLVPAASPWHTADQLWALDRIEAPLISLPSAEAVCRNFQSGLAKLGVEWFPSIEISSLGLVSAYVEADHGIGLVMAIPGARITPALRVLPLPDFEPVTFGALWQGEPSPLVAAFLTAIRERCASVLADLGSVENPALL